MCSVHAIPWCYDFADDSRAAALIFRLRCRTLVGRRNSNIAAAAAAAAAAEAAAAEAAAAAQRCRTFVDCLIKSFPLFVSGDRDKMVGFRALHDSRRYTISRCLGPSHPDSYLFQENNQRLPTRSARADAPLAASRRNRLLSTSASSQ